MDELPEKEIRMDGNLVRCRLGDSVKEPIRNKELPMADVITRHVKQVADFNKALEKRRLWRTREKELESKHKDTWGVLKSEGRTKERRDSPDIVSSSAKRALDSIVVEGVDEEVVKRVKEKVAREFGSVDVHAAFRQRAAREKEARKLQLQNEVSDAWMPDLYYTEELKQVCASLAFLQKTPWFNPVEFLNELHPQQREGSLTPVASDSESDSKGRKKKKKRKKEKKKRKKHKKRKD